MTISTPLNDPIPSAYHTDERLAIRSVARDFAMNEVLPIANELDPIQGEMPMDLRNKMGEMGFFGVLIPEEYGGLGLGLIEYTLITEELARAWMSVASIIARGNGLGGGFSKEQRERSSRHTDRFEHGDLGSPVEESPRVWNRDLAHRRPQSAP